MARYRTQFQTTKTDEQIQAILGEFMHVERFAYETYFGAFGAEAVFKKGDGIVVTMQCIKVLRTENTIFLEAWMKDEMIGEMDLKGFVAALPKKMLRKKVDRLIATLQ